MGSLFLILQTKVINDFSVIVSQWTQMLKIVGHHLEKAGISYCIIQGDIPAKKRMDIVDDFNSNSKGAQVRCYTQTIFGHEYIKAHM